MSCAQTQLKIRLGRLSVQLDDRSIPPLDFSCLLPRSQTRVKRCLAAAAPARRGTSARDSLWVGYGSTAPPIGPNCSDPFATTRKARSHDISFRFGLPASWSEHSAADGEDDPNTAVPGTPSLVRRPGLGWQYRHKLSRGAASITLSNPASPPEGFRPWQHTNPAFTTMVLAGGAGTMDKCGVIGTKTNRLRRAVPPCQRFRVQGRV